MAYNAEQICKNGNRKRSGKWAKKMRNRMIRRVKVNEVPAIKYKGWND